ncbi:MAG: hypothetical protein KJ638_06190, partial [Chloroflexi bacterium]|nr:hypothetical protein [Chloroflexota bacterium]
LPYLGGRALKGLLGAECADILFVLEKADSEKAKPWKAVEQRLFGKTGAALDGEAVLLVGPARLPDDLRAAIAYDVDTGNLTREDVLDTLTALRRQTAMDAGGAPKKETLRTMRVILRETVFEAPLSFSETPTPDDLALLAACIKAFRRAGTGRTRGRGHVVAELLDTNRQPVPEKHFDVFRKAVTP